MTFWQFYLLEVNVTALLLCAVDKACARKNVWRVPETTLLLSAALGGSGGLLMGMLVLRHKTRHKQFVMGVPALLIVQLALLYICK